MKTVFAASIPGRTRNKGFSKLRAAARRAIELHVAYCGMLAEAHDRKHSRNKS